MTAPPPVRRRVGGPTVTVVVDLVRHAFATRSVLLVILVALAVVAAIAAFVGHTVVPWAIYPAL